MASWWKLNRKASGNRLKTLREEEEDSPLCTENSWGPVEMSGKLEEALIF